MTDPAAPLDSVDRSILQQVAAVHERLDPPPFDLDARVLFALSHRPGGDRPAPSWDPWELARDFEVARPLEEELVGSGARAAERTRTITFEADSRTVMITIVERPDGLVRLDGWLAPAARLRVELRFPEPAPSRTAHADEVGRFVFDEVVRGLAQLLVHPADETAPLVVTPSLAL